MQTQEGYNVRQTSMWKSAIAVLGLALTLFGAGSVAADGGEQAPLQLAQVSEDFDPAQVYSNNCAACHDSGAAGAPVMGENDGWASRLDERGFEGLVDNSVEGLNNVMPPQGMCMDCTREELAEVVDYILDNSLDARQE